jgi:hypothetical protein
MKIQREREIGLAGGAVMKTIPHEPLVNSLFFSLDIVVAPPPVVVQDSSGKER